MQHYVCIISLIMVTLVETISSRTTGIKFGCPILWKKQDASLTPERVHKIAYQ